MCRKQFIIICCLSVFISVTINSYSQSNSGSRILMDIKDYPTVFELDSGEVYNFKKRINDSLVSHSIKLLKVTPHFSPNFWNLDDEGNGVKKFFSRADVKVEVDGKLVNLTRRSYELPTTVNGLRIYVEAVKDWAKGADLANLKEIKKDVRLSIGIEGETWGPKSIVYPIQNYRFRSSSYNNTWGALVPYAPLYYHRGEDRGAIPDRLPVHSVISGRVIGSPLPKGDGASNGVIVKDTNGITFRIAHMNTEHIFKKTKLDNVIARNDLIGYTGSTWLGGRNQTHDSHIHVAMKYETDSTTIQLSAFPYLIEAYFRKFTDPALAIAGGYEWTIPGESIVLDGSRSVSRPGEKIKSYKWVLHNGSTVDSVKTRLKFNSPGLYTEELIVETAKGNIDRDFLQVRVWNSTKTRKSERNIAWGWIYQSPVRNVKVGEPVMFWNRIHNTMGSVYIDFGDGSDHLKIYNSIAHPFMKPGRYVVSITGKGPKNDPITEKLEVIVNEK